MKDLVVYYQTEKDGKTHFLILTYAMFLPLFVETIEKDIKQALEGINIYRCWW